jgi:hypothetical protein
MIRIGLDISRHAKHKDNVSCGYLTCRPDQPWIARVGCDALRRLVTVPILVKVPIEPHIDAALAQPVGDLEAPRVGSPGLSTFVDGIDPAIAYVDDRPVNQIHALIPPKNRLEPL